MNDHFFLLSLFTHANRLRDGKFVLKADQVKGVVDNWLYFLSGVSPMQRKRGPMRNGHIKSLEEAARVLNRLVPLYVERPSDRSSSRYFIELKN